MRQFLLSFWEVLEILLVSLISIKIIYTFIAQPFLVYGASMEPNFYTGDYLLIDQITYKFRDPARYDVLVFKHDGKECRESGYYIKRVIGLPGEKVQVSGNRVLINGSPIEEKYLPVGLQYRVDTSANLEEDEYFLMGDNRPWSCDSRNLGPIKRSEVVGEVRLRFWPPTKIEVLPYAQNQT